MQIDRRALLLSTLALAVPVSAPFGGAAGADQSLFDADE